MRMRSTTCLILAVALMACVFLLGCEKPKSYLATPRITIETYMDEARYLRCMIDPLAYSRAIDCFSKAAIGWYKDNAGTLVPNKDLLDGYVGSKREAFVFANFVAPKGPSTEPGRYSIEKVSETKKRAEYIVNDMRLVLVKEGPNWKFESMFGLDAQ